MDVNELYSKADKEFAAKNYDAVLKIADELQRLDPKCELAGYHLEALAWQKLGNPVKEYYARKKVLSLSDFSTLEGKILTAIILSRVTDVCREMGLLAESIDCALLAKKLLNDNASKYALLNAVIYQMHCLENCSPEEFQAVYADYERCFTNIVPYPRKFYEHEKIRVGFISADFREHPLVKQSWALLTKLDRNLFEVYFYSNVQKPDGLTKHLSEISDGWRDIHNLVDEEAAKLIRDDEIDILFDLSGHMKDNRLAVAAYHPASVQMSGIGDMGSTGLSFFDYFLSDIYCAGNPAYFVEKLIKLPHSHFCHEPSTDLEPAAEPPCLKNKFVTFGSFNQFVKMTGAILSTWKKILDAVPNSRLILKHKIFNTEDGRNFVRERLSNFGFDLERVELRPFSANHLAEYADVDIALDTFPYTGGLTTCEALYMGVPVISLYGARHGSRFGLSILKNIGLDALAVDSYDEYINHAVMLANDWELLTILRKNLRTKMQLSPLMDSENYLREIQDTFIYILDEQKNLWRSSQNDS